LLPPQLIYVKSHPNQGCQSSVQSVLVVARDGTEVVGLWKTRTTGFRAGEMRTDTLQGPEWTVD
jgi:hypothetical protein